VNNRTGSSKIILIVINKKKSFAIQFALKTLNMALCCFILLAWRVHSHRRLAQSGREWRQRARYARVQCECHSVYVYGMDVHGVDVHGVDVHGV
jgi:hypothetical protein